MGKHRHELAAAFFLLGGDLDSAVSVCTKNLEDPQLGLVVCRLVEGPDGPVGRKLINKHVLPGALRAKDYWLASLCQVCNSRSYNMFVMDNGQLRILFEMFQRYHRHRGCSL